MSKSHPPKIGEMWYNIARSNTGVIMLEDKIFELMEKLYQEFSLNREETNKRFDSMDERFDRIDVRLDGMDVRLDGMDERFDIIEHKLDEKANRSDIIRLENDLKPKVMAALDGYKVVYEKLGVLHEEVLKISKKVEAQEVELRVIRSAE